MFVLLGLCILLAAILLINSIASFLGAVLWRGLRKPARRWSAASRAGFIGTLRIVPVAIAFAAVVLLFAPAYLIHEPRTDHEDVSLRLAIVAVFSAVGIAIALLRGLLTWRVTSRLSNDWLQHAKPVRLAGIAIPAYEVEHQFPVIAIVGTFRPRLFIASRVLTSLSSDELAAAINHEAGHLVHGDNLMRGLMRACRDSLLIIPCGRSLDTAWKDASEEAADEHAARMGAGAALDLASSLVKISRMIPAGQSPVFASGAFFVTQHDKGAVTTRVRRLLNLANDDRRSTGPRHIARRTTWLPITIMVIVVALASSQPHVLLATHSLIEEVVSALN